MADDALPDCQEWRADTGVESDVYECLFTFVYHSSADGSRTGSHKNTDAQTKHDTQLPSVRFNDETQGESACKCLTVFNSDR